jgi:hypothetical protein
MENKKASAKKVTAKEDTTVKKSGVTLYWEKRRRLGYPKGEILDMRAVLK